MYYIYVTMVLALVAVILWMMMCFSYAMQQQRKLNQIWEWVSQLLQERYLLLYELVGLWSRPEAPPPDAGLQLLQQLLEQEEALNWQDVARRAHYLQQINAVLPQVVQMAQAVPVLAQGEALDAIVQQLEANNAQLVRTAEGYNRAVRVYNAMLLKNPTRMMAAWFGYKKVPLFSFS